ncbi:MAG: SusD/RagB family nutrient-binding outer membrane lipoprotein, partial [Bacteroidetes bacterium]
MPYKYLPLVAVLLLGCTKDFEEINTNPNAPEEVNPQFLLSNVIWNAANNNAVDAWNAGNFLGQLTARKDFNEIDRWDLRSNQELWDKTYHLLKDLQLLIALGERENPAYIGPALVLRAFLASTLTDLWGDVPYTDALLGDTEGNFTPRYDRQEDIYLGPEGILATLQRAVEALDEARGGLPLQGDVLFQGDLEKWVRFANSLRVRYLLRISKRVDVSAQLQALVNEGRLMQSNADNALVPYLSTAPNQWFVHNI